METFEEGLARVRAARVAAGHSPNIDEPHVLRLIATVVLKHQQQQQTEEGN